MSTREMVINILDLLTEEQLKDVMMFAEDFLTPNDETKKAIEETEYILQHPDEYKSYSSIEEILNDE